MAVSHSDRYILSTDPNFQNRVRSSVIAACVSIENEGWNVAFHRERETFVSQVMNGPDAFKSLFATSVATDANVIADATPGGTVALTSGNVAAQAVLVTDAHIDAAVSAQFNTFFRTPGT